MKLTKYVKTRQEKFGMVIFETLKEKIFVANDTGREILRLIEEGNALEHIIKKLETEYANDNMTGERNIKTDVIDFINKLEQEGILTNK